MSKNIETRIQQLEHNIIDSQEPIPYLVYISGLPNIQTFEEAKAEYMHRHGFAPENDFIFEIVAYDGRRKTEEHD